MFPLNLLTVTCEEDFEEIDIWSNMRLPLPPDVTGLPVAVTKPLSINGDGCDLDNEVDGTGESSDEVVAGGSRQRKNMPLPRPPVGNWLIAMCWYNAKIKHVAQVQVLKENI